MKRWGRSGRRMSYFPHCAVNFPIELSLQCFNFKVYHTIAETWTANKSSKCSSYFQSKTHYLYVKHHKTSHYENSQKGEVAPNPNVTSMHWSAKFVSLLFLPKNWGGIFFFCFSISKIKAQSTSHNHQITVLDRLQITLCFGGQSSLSSKKYQRLLNLDSKMRCRKCFKRAFMQWGRKCGGITVKDHQPSALSKSSSTRHTCTAWLHLQNKKLLKNIHLHGI